MDDPIIEDHDILILGAGLSGINAAHLLRLRLPHRSFTLLESRDRIGGTWSFFKYPGFRSDSSMSTFGLQWHPWPHATKIGMADKIAAYLESAVDSEPGLREKIKLGHRVVAMAWSSEREKWRLDVEVDGSKRVVMDARFVVGCTGYYDYENPLESAIPGLSDFQGQIAHPQFWPDDLDITSKRVALIGSGATTVTLLPQFVDKAAQVTMIQRSPSYVTTMPTISRLEQWLKVILPLAWVHWFAWWKDTLYELVMSQIVLTFPTIARMVLRKETKGMLPADVDVDVHFNPRYPPMLQRLCLTPDAEFFKCLHRDNCEIITDTIKTVTKDGLILDSGRKIEADIIVTATGLRVHLLGGLIPTVDGQNILPGSHYCWRGCMLTDLPNTAFIFGYVTTTWTPGSDQMSKIICKLLTHMEKRGAKVATPKIDQETVLKEDEKLAVKISSAYILKAAERIPKVTGKGVWYGRENLAKDTWALMFGDMDEGMMYSGFDDKKKR